MKITLPKNAHSMQYRVIYADTDSGGVVYYGNYMRFFEQGRTELLRDNGFTYRDLEELGYIMPVVECYSRYKASARYDDLVTIQTAVSEVKKVSCRFSYRITNSTTDKLLVLGSTVNAIVDRNGRLSSFPADLFHTLKELAAE